MVLAARGARDLDDGEQPVDDEQERSLLRAQARSVYTRSGLLAVLGTLMILLFPL